MVHASEQFDVAVGRPAGKVAGAIHSRVRLVAERVADEFFGGQLRTIEIAACQTVAADEQFAGHTNRNRLEITVENIKLRVGNRPTDDDRGVARLNLRGSRPNGRLGWAVKVPKPRTAFQQSVRQLARQRFAAAKNPQ